MAKKQFNFNVGVLGHVDSGKTSLTKALSTTASTACFDKNPQSKERGITLDLGFSSFTLDLNDEAKQRLGGHDAVQYTLVDCPGHASLIRTVIGGAQIIDLMFLVVDVVKGMQTQTAECLLIGQVLCSKMIVVLNKVDLIPAEKRSTVTEKMKKKILKTLDSTRFKDSPVIAVSACAGCQDQTESSGPIGIQDLISLLLQYTYCPSRSPDGPFVFAVDHCFSIRGQGTVMTGTVLGGSAAVNQTVEIPSMKVNKKIKSIQMFKKPVDSVMQGDRAGICVTQFDPKQLERGLVCTPGSIPTIVAALVNIQRISYFKGQLSSKSKFHITVGHETVMGRMAFFSYTKETVDGAESFDFTREYVYEEEVQGAGEEAGIPKTYFALLELDKPVTCLPSSIFIGSRLDADIHANSCRLAFHGKILEAITHSNYMTSVMPNVKVFKTKSREGLVERAPDKYSVIVKNLFKKESDISTFTGLKVRLSSGEMGMIEGGFGQSGKVKVRISEGLNDDVYNSYGGGKSKKKNRESEEESSAQKIRVTLTFKRYIYDLKKAIKQ